MVANVVPVRLSARDLFAPTKAALRHRSARRPQPQHESRLRPPPNLQACSAEPTQAQHHCCFGGDT